MRKAIVLPLIAVVLIGGAGGGYYVYKRGQDHLRLGQEAIHAGDLRRAAIELRNAVRERPKNVNAHLQLAYVQARLGDPVASEKELREALGLGADPAAVTPQLVQSYVDQGHFRELLAEFPIPNGGPPELAARIAMGRAIAEMRLKQPERAQEAAAAAEKLAPTLAEAAYTSAQIAFLRGDRTEAESAVDRALKLDPKMPTALVMKSDLQSQRGDADGAMKTAADAVTVAPNFINARLTRANLLMNIGQDAKAREDLDIALKADPKNILAIYLNGALLTRAKDWRGADEAFTKIGSVLQRFPRAFFFVAIVKANLGQLEQATDFASRYVTKTPEDIEGIKLLARIAISAKRADQAVEMLSKAASAGRADAETLDLLGRAYALSGQPARAIQSFRKASDLAPENIDILTRLASTRLGSGDPAGAASDLERSLQIAPNATNVNEALVVAALAAGDIPKALAALQKLREKDGETETVGNLAGLIKLSQIDLDGARAQFETVLRDHPKSIPAKLNLAKIAALQGRQNETEQLLADVLEQQPANDAALTGLVGIFMNTGRIGRAITAVEAARAASPGNPTMTSALSDLEIRAGDAKKAMAILDEAPKDQGGLPVLLGARARAQTALNQISEAKDTYRRILSGTPGDLDARARLVELLLSSNDYPAAKIVVQEGMKITPHNFPMLETLVRIEARANGIDSAVALADQLLRDPANMPEARLLKGDLYVGARQFDKAEAAYSAELKAQPATILATRLAVVQINLGHIDQAIQTLLDWVAKNPDDVVALSPLSSLETQVKRYDQAMTHLEAIIAKRPNDASALNNLAWIYQVRKDPRALAVAQKSYILGPTAESADTLGWIMTISGDPAKGAPLLKLASERLTNNPVVMYHYGVALARNGQKEEAIRVLTVAVSMPANFDEKADAQKLLADLSASR